jgi:hypothetical protein
MFSLTGIYIDGSHTSAVDFQVAVIHFAHEQGFEMEWDRFISDINTLKNVDISEVDMDTLLGCSYQDISEAIDWTYEDAIDYLNTNTREGLYWEVIDQSLYLTEDADASQ